MKQFRIRKDDKVMVIAGKDQGKIGKVLKVLHKHDSVVVEKVNVAKRHVKPNPYRREPGGIVDKEMPIHVSNLMVVCPACAAPTRVGDGFLDGNHDDIAHGGVTPMRAAQHLDAGHFLGAGVIGNLKRGFNLDHDVTPTRPVRG